MTENVTYIREELKIWLPLWNKIDDAVAGEPAVKTKGDAYLPRPNPTDKSPENLTRFEQYLDRAVFFNATGRTLEGLVGIAYRRRPNIVVPETMDFVYEDIDGAGGGIVNQTHRALEYVMKNGRAGLLADFPARNEAISRAEMDERGLHATITLYQANRIINWRVDDQQDLSLVVLHEVLEEADGYGVALVNQYRELAMGRFLNEEEDASRRYIVRIWRDGDGGPELVAEYEPTDAAGNSWDFIPFTFIGSVDNNHEVDKPPLLDLANLNIAHYRNSADFEESAFFVGQPSFVFAGLDEQWLELMQEAGVYVGSRAAVPLPVGGSATLLQAAPNTLSQEGMKAKESQMVALGARLLTHGEAIKTAEQSRSETAAAHSVLSLACDNVSSAYQISLQWAMYFTQAQEEDIVFQIPTDFTGLSADPALIQALIAGWQQQALPASDLWAALRQLGVINPEKTDEEIQEEIDFQTPGLDLEADDEEPAPAEPEEPEMAQEEPEEPEA